MNQKKTMSKDQIAEDNKNYKIKFIFLPLLLLLTLLSLDILKKKKALKVTLHKEVTYHLPKSL